MGSQSEELLRRRDAVVPRGVARVTAATAARAEGAVIVDADGRELIDLASGIGVVNAGHCPPPLVQAVREQAGRLIHTCIHVATYEPYVALCEKLVELLPHGPATKVMLVNTGAEAVENAVKVARQATGRPAVLCFTEAFHGRTLLGLSLTSKHGYKLGCGPFAPEIYRLPFPNLFRYGDGLSPEAFVGRELARLEEAFVNVVPASHLAAVLIEPIQGEGGFNVAPPEYLRGLREICDRHRILLICDEVQSGFCRTGRWAAYEHAGVVPDLSTWAKSLGGGLPIAAVVGRAEVMDACLPGTLGGTYGGTPVACAGALANIRLLEEWDANRRAVEIGRTVRERLLRLQERLPDVVADVRGLGAMIAMELVCDGDVRRPATALVRSVVDGCVAHGVLLLSAGSYSNVVRLLPPLAITVEQLGRALDVLEEQVMAALTPAA